MTRPSAAHAQRPAVPIIGHLNSGSPEAWQSRLTAFRRGLSELGFFEGKNVDIEYRWADGQYDKLSALAADLVARNVSVIVATGGSVSASAAKQATSVIPIVFANGSDPVSNGLVKSLSRPEGNATGISFLVDTMVAKQVQLLHEVVPKATVVGFLVNHTSQNAVEGWTQMERAAQSLGLSAVRVEASKEADFDACFATLVQNKVEGLVIGPDPFFTRARERIIGLASRHNIPSINNTREFSTSGGLISYGTSVVEANYQAGIYVARILNGTKPSDLPVQQSTKVELIINLKAAKSLGIAFPISLLGRADEVIE